MKRTPVESSDVKSIGFYAYFDIDTDGYKFDMPSGTLEVEFHRNGIYTYFDVTEADYNAVVHSESIGKALHAIVTKGGYAYSKVANYVKEQIP